MAGGRARYRTTVEATETEWAWRFGPRAAKYYGRWFRSMRLYWPTGCAGMTALITGALAHMPDLLWAGLGAFGVALLLMIYADVCLVKRHYATEKALGIRLNAKHGGPPPVGKEGYLRWCERRGLEPYPFRPPDPDMR